MLAKRGFNVDSNWSEDNCKDNPGECGATKLFQARGPRRLHPSSWGFGLEGFEGEMGVAAGLCKSLRCIGGCASSDFGEGVGHPRRIEH